MSISLGNCVRVASASPDWIPSHFKFSSLCQLKSSDISNVKSWKVRRGRVKVVNKYLPRWLEMWHISHHANARPAFCTGKHILTPHPPPHPTSTHFIFGLLWSSTYRQRPYQNIKTRKEERDEEMLKALCVSAETIQLQCLSNVASQVIASNCLTKNWHFSRNSVI